MLKSFKIRNYLLQLICIGILNVMTATHATANLDRIVAIVEDEIITMSELQQKITLVTNNLEQQKISLPAKKILAQQVLEKMILDLIQLQMAKQFGIEIDSDTVSQVIKDLAKNQKLTVEKYKQKLSSEGINLKNFREQLKHEITISRLQQKEIINELRISPAEIEGYLNSPAGQDHSGTEYRLNHILIASPETPNAENLKELDLKGSMIMQELKQGKDFQQLAASYSSGTQALNGGDLGWRKLSEIPTLFVKNVINMQVNEVVGPIKSSSGLHIIKLKDKRSGEKFMYQELKARQIFMHIKEGKNEQDLVTILMRLRNKVTEDKQDFAKLARDKSEESNTAAKGGDLGWFKQSSVFPEFWEKVNKLKPGEISQPFKTRLGWHLVKLEGRRDVATSTDTAKERALEILREQKFNEALEAWLKKIRSTAKVEIFL